MKSKVKEHWFQKVEKMHPYQMMVYLGMVGSGIIFLFLTVSLAYTYAISAASYSFYLPWPFYASTVVMVTSSLFASRLLSNYGSQHFSQLQDGLAITCMLGLLFSLLQLWGWWELTQMGVGFRGLPFGSYLYVLTGIHISHLFGVMAFALALLLEVHGSARDAVKELVFSNNPYVKMKFQLLVTYWHFMDAIWLILFIILVLIS